MFASKKGQGISMETIVIAVIVIFVLVVLLLVFTSRNTIFVKDVNSCKGICNQDTCDFVDPGDTSGVVKTHAVLGSVTDSSQCKQGGSGNLCCSTVGVPKN